MSVVRRWVDLWNHKESPKIMSLVRIGVGLILAIDFLTLWQLDLIHALFLPTTQGGLLNPSAQVPLWSLISPSPALAHIHFAVLLGTSITLMLGIYSRASALLLMVASAQFALMHPAGDRGIDMMLRNVLLILAFSTAGQAWSVEAWWTSGSVHGDGQATPGWPRRLLLAQLVYMYFTAGVQKYAGQWWPWGHFSALYVIWHDWAVSDVAGQSWLSSPGVYPLTQLATSINIAWECGAPLWLWWWWLLATPERGGSLRAWVRRLRPDLLFAAIGVFFHLSLAATMNLGIFPWAMLALYPAFLKPEELQGIVTRLKSTVI